MLRLVGGWRTAVAAHDHGLMMELWPRLPQLLPRPDELGRLLRFAVHAEATDPAARSFEFLGLELQGEAELPPDLCLWELGEQEWTLWRQGASGLARIESQPLRWLWRERSPFENRWLGECVTRLPQSAGLGEGERRLELIGLAPVMRERQAPDEVRLLPYDAEWPRQFAASEAWLREALGPDFPGRIEHFGSTAIPGMPAKPILDILVEVPTMEDARRRVLPRLCGPAWEYWWYGDKVMLVRRAEPLGPRTHHLHVAPLEHPVWRGVAFRDRLRRDPAVAAEYLRLKQGLAEAHGQDREAYTAGKADFIQRVLAASE